MKIPIRTVNMPANATTPNSSGISSRASTTDIANETICPTAFCANCQNRPEMVFCFRLSVLNWSYATNFCRNSIYLRFYTLLIFVLKKWQKWFFNLQKIAIFGSEVARRCVWRTREDERSTCWLCGLWAICSRKTDKGADISARRKGVKDLLFGPNSYCGRSFCTIADTLIEQFSYPQHSLWPQFLHCELWIMRYFSPSASLDFIF